MNEQKDDKILQKYKLTRTFRILIAVTFLLAISICSASANTLISVDPNPMIQGKQAEITVQAFANSPLPYGALFWEYEIVGSAKNVDASDLFTFTPSFTDAGDSIKYYFTPKYPGQYVIDVKTTYDYIDSTNNYLPDHDIETTQLTVNVEPSTSSVPEFPSIAVPVAAILGLVVIFGRKKNMV